jgi:hypothetical protein
MKSETPDSTPFSQRRRWLGAFSATAAGLAAWAWPRRGRRAAMSSTAPDRMPRPASSSTNASGRLKLVLKPAPESVKRHG